MGLRKGRDDDGNRKDDKDKGPSPQEQLLKILTDTPGLIARLHTEYNKYFSGAEKKPPRELRESLDKTIDKIKSMRKFASTQSLNFKLQNVLNSYLSYATSWDKRMQQLESSKR